jgi:hypothetical protein
LQDRWVAENGQPILQIPAVGWVRCAAPNPSTSFAAQQKPIIIGATYETDGLPKTVNPSYGTTGLRDSGERGVFTQGPAGVRTIADSTGPYALFGPPAINFRREFRGARREFRSLLSDL